MGKWVDFRKWQQYEMEKRRLQALDLSPKEYQKRVREIAKRLGL